jgi:hypothetical protein
VPNRVLRDGEVLPYGEAVGHAACQRCGFKLAWHAHWTRGAMFALCCRVRYWLEAVTVKVTVERE